MSAPDDGPEPAATPALDRRRAAWSRSGAARRLRGRDWVLALLVMVAVTAVKWELGERWYPVPPRPGRYGAEVGHIAANVAAGNGMSLSLRPGEVLPSAWFSPLYPLFMGRVFEWKGTFSRESAVFLVRANGLFQGLTAGLLFLLGVGLVGRLTGLIAAGLFALDPNAWEFLSWTWPTHLFTLLVTLHLAVLVLVPVRARLAGTAAGLTLALALLADGAAITLLPVTLVHLGLARVRMGTWKPLVTGVLALAVALTPWTLRNARVLGSANPLRGNVGVNLWVGNHEQNRSEDFHGLKVSPWHDPAEQHLMLSLGEHDYDRLCRQRALEVIESRPWRFVCDSARRASAFWFGEWWLGFAHAPRRVTVAFFVATLAAALGAWRARRLGIGPLVATALLFGLPYYVTVHGHGRYRAPIQPALWTLAALAVVPASRLQPGTGAARER
jgi:hypothetical protein